MPLWPGTGIPYGKSPFAFSAGTADACSTVTLGVTFSSLTRLVGCSRGVGDASAGLGIRELGRRATRFVFLSAGLGVGRGWKAFETDWLTFLKKSPIGSAFTHGPLAKNSTATGNEIQRDRIKLLIWSSAFNLEMRFSLRVGVLWKQNFLVPKFVLSSKRIMQPEQLRGITSHYDKDFVIIVLRHADCRGDPKRL